MPWFLPANREYGLRFAITAESTVGRHIYVPLVFRKCFHGRSVSALKNRCFQALQRLDDAPIAYMLDDMPTSPLW
jgi:hypothetical protein